MHNDWKLELLTLLQLADFNGACRIKGKHIPQRLFKYVSLSARKEEKFDALINDLIWVSDPAGMNDPYDSGLYFLKNTLGDFLIKNDFDSFAREAKLAKFFSLEEIKRIDSSPDLQEGIIHLLKEKFPERAWEIERIQPFLEDVQNHWHEQLLNQFNRTLKSSLKISCFSECPDSLLMWSHYAGIHTGICIEYNFSNLPITDYANRFVYPVIYAQNFYDATTLLKECSYAPVILPLLASLYKSPEWSYEKEWRMVVAGGLLERDSYFKVPTPSAIYLGSRINEEDKTKLIQIARSKGIEVGQMQMNPMSFGMSLKELGSK